MNKDLKYSKEEERAAKVHKLVLGEKDIIKCIFPEFTIKHDTKKIRGPHKSWCYSERGHDEWFHSFIDMAKSVTENTLAKEWLEENTPDAEILQSMAEKVDHEEMNRKHPK